MQHELLSQHGGLRGVRDENALESALGRARDKWTYDPDADLAAIAAAYGFGLAKNHAYNDGNKRIAFVAMYTFLGLNDLEIEAPEPAVVQLMVDVASGTTSESELAAWLRGHVVPLKYE
ncbi:MAG: type II toxin-antitoxin system death-on-curing family toxin [bacterium]